MRRERGFTMVELVTVMVLIGILAAVAVPRLMGKDTTGTLVFGEQVVSALRYSQKTAVAQRRLVCATLQGKEVTLRISEEPGSPPASGVVCGLPLGDNDYNSRNSSSVAGAGAFAGAAAIALFFQPNGTVTLDAAGTRPVSAADEVRIVDEGAAQRTIRIAGATGNVR